MWRAIWGDGEVLVRMNRSRWRSDDGILELGVGRGTGRGWLVRE